jgi:hypothetical protein
MSQLEVGLNGLSERDYYSKLGINFQEFNELFCQAIDDCISELFGANVLSSLYAALEEHHSVNRDELPYRIETMYSVLEFVFGVKGAHTIEKRIIRRFYDKLGLTFPEVIGYTLGDYIELARTRMKLNRISIVPLEARSNY